MPTPRLIHPVPIVIETMNRAATLMDDDYREPIQQAARNAAITVSGQVWWGEDKGLYNVEEGPVLQSDGNVLFRYKDLAAAGLSTLKLGDRFTKLGTIAVDVYVIKVQPMGHYPSAGGPTLLKAFFRERQSRGSTP